MMRCWLILTFILLSSSFIALAEQNSVPLEVRPQQNMTQPLNPAGAETVEELVDIKGPIEIPDNKTTILLITAAVCALIFLVMLIIFWRKRSKKQKAIQAHDAALLNLQSAQSLIDDHKVGDFVNLIDQTLRKYIEQRFAITASRQTTREFIDTLTDNSAHLPSILTENTAHLQAWRDQFDMVKFARADMQAKTMEQILSGLRSFITSTRMEADT